MTTYIEKPCNTFVFTKNAKTVKTVMVLADKNDGVVI